MTPLPSYDDRQAGAVLVVCANPQCRKSYFMTTPRVLCFECSDFYQGLRDRRIDVSGNQIFEDP